jgi:hypothetical protein
VEFCWPLRGANIQISIYIGRKLSGSPHCVEEAEEEEEEEGARFMLSS